MIARCLGLALFCSLGSLVQAVAAAPEPVDPAGTPKGAQAFWTTGHITAEMDHWLMEGLDDIYKMEFDKGEEAARKVIAINPDHPHAYLGLAGIAWVRYVYGADQSDQSLMAPFEQRVADTIDAGKRWLKQHPNDPEALITMGAALGITSRLQIIHHQWVRGYFTGRKALALTREAARLDPTLADAYLGIGMYDYYSDVYPRFIGVLAKLVLRGNRQRGIEELKMVAEKGHYSQSTAKVLLVEIYTEDAFGARDPAKALAITREMRVQYPNSALMHSAELVSLYECKRYDEAAAGAKDYIERVKKRMYNPIEDGKGYVILGAAEWARGDHEKALAAFRAAQGIDYAGRPSRWAVWGHVWAGRLEDVLGRRQDAIADYKAVLAEPDTWDFHTLAKAGLSKPYRLNAAGYPGPIPPP